MALQLPSKLVADPAAQENFERIEGAAQAAPDPVPSVIGSRASGAAFVSLLSVLAAQGLIIDNTVA